MVRRHRRVPQHPQQRVERDCRIKVIRRRGQVRRRQRVVAVQARKPASDGSPRLVDGLGLQLLGFLHLPRAPHAADALHGQQTLAVDPFLVLPVRVGVEGSQDAQRSQQLRSNGPRLLRQHSKHQGQQPGVLVERAYDEAGGLDELAHGHDRDVPGAAHPHAVDDEHEQLRDERRDALAANLRELADRPEHRSLLADADDVRGGPAGAARRTDDGRRVDRGLAGGVRLIRRRLIRGVRLAAAVRRVAVDANELDDLAGLMDRLAVLRTGNSRR